MEIRELKYFIAIAREGNITKAAEALYITQPTLSRQLGILENELGVQLFERGHRKMILTDKGKLLYHYALEIMELHQKAERELKEKDHIAGEIVIGCAVASSIDLFAQVLRDFNRLYQEVKINLITGSRDQILEKMEMGTIDLGLVIGYVGNERYKSLKLRAVDRFGLLMKKDSPLAAQLFIKPEDLKGIPLTVPLSTNHFSLVDWYGGGMDSLNLYGTHDMLNNAASLVEVGICYALTLEAAAKQYYNPQLCFRPLAPELRCESFVIWNDVRSYSLTVSTFIDYLNKRLHE